MWWGWLWTPILRSDGFERRTNIRWWLWMPKLRSDGSEHRTKIRWWLWTPKRESDGSECQRRCDDGSERRNREYDSERQPRKWIWWLWTLKLKSDGGSERRTTRKWWERNMPQCGMPLQISIRWKGPKETLWAPKEALLASQNDQVDGEHSLRTCPKKSRGLSECRNKPNSSNS